jgi:hypothetical protein
MEPWTAALRHVTKSALQSSSGIECRRAATKSAAAPRHSMPSCSNEVRCSGSFAALPWGFVICRNPAYADAAELRSAESKVPSGCQGLRNFVPQSPRFHRDVRDCGTSFRRNPTELKFRNEVPQSRTSRCSAAAYAAELRTSLLHDGILCRCCSAARTSLLHHGILCRCSGLRCCTTAFYAAAARSSSADFVAARRHSMPLQRTSYNGILCRCSGLRTTA